MTKQQRKCRECGIEHLPDCKCVRCEERENKEAITFCKNNGLPSLAKALRKTMS